MTPAPPLTRKSLEALRIAVKLGAVRAGKQRALGRVCMVYGRTLTALAARGFLMIDRGADGRLWGSPTIAGACAVIEAGASRRDGSSGRS
jgi:hypothetical protein